jgi:hypothetical protein
LNEQKHTIGEPIQISDLLPTSKKDCDLIKFKQNYFFEEKEETQQALQKLQPILNSKVKLIDKTLFHN